MTERVRKVLEDAKALEPDERAILAAELLALVERERGVRRERGRADDLRILASESALSDWDRPEEDCAWAPFQPAR